jgi:hypothetical protein
MYNDVVLYREKREGDASEKGKAHHQSSVSEQASQD